MFISFKYDFSGGRPEKKYRLKKNQIQKIKTKKVLFR